MQQQNLANMGSHIWVSNRAGPTPVVQHFHCQAPPGAENRDAWEGKPGRRAGSVPQKSTSRLQNRVCVGCVCRLCVKVRSCEETHTFSQSVLPKPQGEFGSQEALGLALCRRGCASWAAGVWAVSLARPKSEPVKLSCVFPPASDALQLTVFQVSQGTLISIEILDLEKKLSTQIVIYARKIWKSNQEKRVDVIFS